MYAVIMAGGAGTRFWPASRKARPKQLLDLWGEPMIRRTCDRLRSVVPLDAQWIITGAHLVEPIAAAVPDLPRPQIIAEPVGRNTAPCVGLGAMLLQALHGPDAVFGLFPADHFIQGEEAFAQCLRAAYAEAANDAIVTLGIPPTRPETGYGYIRLAHKPSAQAATRPEAIAVEAFVEKPDRHTALGYLESGTYLWNAGIFVARVSTMLAEIERQMPDLYAGLRELEKSFGTERFAAALEAIYPTLPSTSIDYGVMENAGRVLTIPVTFGWSDVGHWGALDETLPADEAGNVGVGRTLHIDSRQSIAVSTTGSDKLVVTLGMEGVVVVDTPDALLVCPRDKVQDVRKVVTWLEKEGREELL